MKLELATSVASKLTEDKDVLSAEVEKNGYDDPTIVARVPDEHSRRRVKSTLHQYPFYIELEVDNP